MELKLFLLFKIFLFISIGINKVLSLKCYTCTAGVGDVDQRCVTNPGSVEGQNILDCNMLYCTSKRVEYKDPPNKVHSMHRGCDNDPEKQNTIDEDDTFITYYTACRKNLCNGGNGKGGDGGVGLDPETGEAGVLLVKGNNAITGKSLSMTLILGMILSIFMINFM